MISKFSKALALTALVCGSAAAELADVPAGTYELEDTHGYISFSYTHLGFSRPVVGFESFGVTLELDQDNVADSTLSVAIDATSVASRVAEFDDHLKGDKWFDVANNPDISFVATDIEAAGDDKFSVTGDLTIKGKTMPVTLDAVINKAAPHPFSKKPTIGVSASATLKRSDWGLGAYAPAVSDEVVLDIQTELRLAE